ncbi:acyl-CoA dehydrogenase [Nocardia gamkensis]|uniref:acyl-CoA dehydrogenase n=1 Tax=Nocardia gamkensis TaxID=352869 RepID=UPI0036E6DE7A
MSDISWNLVEERVYRRFEELAHAQDALGSGVDTPAEHYRVDALLADLGWAEIEANFPTEACELLFRTQGRTLAQTDCLNRTMLAEMSCVPDGVEGIVIPDVRWGEVPRAAQEVSGIIIGPLPERVAVPVSGPMGTVSVGAVDSSRLDCQHLDTFDSSVVWTSVSGPLDFPLVEASTEWYRAVSAAQRGLATELIALADSMVAASAGVCGDHVPADLFPRDMDSIRTRLVEASADLEAARSLLAESWRYGGRLSALAAKCAAGRAHRAISELTLQSLGLQTWSHEPPIARYVARGMQLDALCGSHERLEAILGERLFEIYSPGQPLPSIVV